MAEMHTIDCPSCETGNQPRTAVDGLQEYRCAACGLVYYGPCGCDTTGAGVDVAATTRTDAVRSVSGACTVRVAGDWETAVPRVGAHDRAASFAHPGC